jgi:hypothetical protein
MNPAQTSKTEITMGIKNRTFHFSSVNLKRLKDKEKNQTTLASAQVNLKKPNSAGSILLSNVTIEATRWDK